MKVSVRRFDAHDGFHQFSYGTFDDIQDFDPKTWNNEDLAKVLDDLHRHGIAIEYFPHEAIVYTALTQD